MEYAGATLSPGEVEVMVRELQPFTFADIGTEKWKSQRDAVEQLNMCTHSNAVNKVDDFVKSFLIDHEKLPVLLHELLMMEVWRHRVVSVERRASEPSAAALLEAIAGNPTAAYMYCYYESVVVNLLECVCFYEETITGFGDDILELIDYCWRQVSFLFSMEQELSRVQRVEDEAAAAASGDAVERLVKSLKQQNTSRAMACISILWFIVDRLDDLPLSVSNSVLNKNDLLVGLSEILVLQPWLRRVKLPDGTVGHQKFKSGAFANVSGDEVLVVCTPEAHAWFCVHKLLCDPEVRRRYQYTTYKKEIILKVRRFMNETLMDQIPALENVHRALEELSFLEPPSGTEEKFKSNNLIIIEQVPRTLTAVMAPVGGAAEAARTEESAWVLRERQRAVAMLRDPSTRARDAMRMAKIFDQMFAGQA